MRVQAAPAGMARQALIVRDSTEADIPAIAAIYRHHVLTGLASFEEVAPDPAEIARRRAAIVEAGMPWLVVEDEAGGLLGYAYAGPYRPRPGYRYTAEDSVYVAPRAVGRGVGRAALAALVARCETLGFRQLVAVILSRSKGVALPDPDACRGMPFASFDELALYQRLVLLADGAPTPPPAPPTQK